jgi:nucleotide-binding universal stress UspA family protein
MIATHILVGHDGSRDAETAFEDALDLAGLARARLSVVSVASPPEPPTEVETQAAIELATRHYEELFDGLRRQAQERNVKLETYVLVGHPADQILKTAARYGANMIVVGHRGRSAIRDWVSGSTSRRVFTHATCPVLVVRAR